MTQNNSTGYYSRGEVEDYRVVVEDFPLAVSLLKFDVSVTNEEDVKINWSSSEEGDFHGYDIQRSKNGGDWETIAFVPKSEEGGLRHYELRDNDPYRGVSFYRLKLTGLSGVFKYSMVKSVTITDLMSGPIHVFPNPTMGEAKLSIRGDEPGEVAHITIIDQKGNQLYYQKLILTAGANTMNIPIQASWPSGLYIIRVTTDRKTVNKNLVLRRQ
jgi:hypothetical protein